MNIALQDIRELGYRKIHSSYIRTVGDTVTDEALETINNLSVDLRAFSLQPYGFLKYWVEVKTLGVTDIGGYKSLVSSFNPTLSISEVNESDKRKFRNNWTTIWTKYGEAVGLSDAEVMIVSDVGVKLPIVMNAYYDGVCKTLPALKSLDLNELVEEGLINMIEFYNAVLNWYCITQVEGELVLRSKNVLDIIRVLVEVPPFEFVAMLANKEDLLG